MMSNNTNNNSNQVHSNLEDSGPITLQEITKRITLSERIIVDDGKVKRMSHGGGRKYDPNEPILYQFDPYSIDLDKTIDKEFLFKCIRKVLDENRDYREQVMSMAEITNPGQTFYMDDSSSRHLENILKKSDEFEVVPRNKKLPRPILSRQTNAVTLLEWYDEEEV
jgi:hypothetical protein